MRNQVIRSLFAAYENNLLSRVVIETNTHFYEIDSDGFFRLPKFVVPSESILPGSFMDKRIVEIRCGGGDVAIKLEDNSYITMSWMIDTSTGESYQDVYLYPSEDVDKEFVESFEELNECEERKQANDTR